MVTRAVFGEGRDEKYADSNLVWVDMEMSGLDPETCRVLEIAAIVTDAQLNEIAVGPVIAVHQPDSVLDNMDEWNTEHHNASGLVARCRASTVDEEAACDTMRGFLSRYVPAGRSPLCGNSIHQDRRFLVRWMPRLESFFHYRNVDVSSIKELVRRWSPEIAGGFFKQTRHEALSDVRDSIDELRYYRKRVFKI